MNGIWNLVSQEIWKVEMGEKATPLPPLTSAHTGKTGMRSLLQQGTRPVLQTSGQQEALLVEDDALSFAS